MVKHTRYSSTMKLDKPPEGCYVFNSKVFSDLRGDTLCWKSDKFETNAIRQSMLVSNHKGVVRGMHCAQYGKQVVCLSGKIFDVMVDMRKDSPTYGDWFGVNLEGSESIYVPAGIAHGYISLENSQVLYSLEGSWTEAKRDKTLYWKDPRVDIDWPELPVEPILSDKDKVHGNTFEHLEESLYGGKEKRVLVYGGKGYLGSQACKYLEEADWDVILGESRCNNYSATLMEIKALKPNVVFCSVGRSGIPSSTWHDDNPLESVENNIDAVVSLCKACKVLKLRVVVLGTGFVFSGGSDENPNLDNGKHCPNNTFYCHMRSIVEKTLTSMGNVLTLRVNYPTTSDKDPRGMFGKLSNATKVHDDGSSITVVDSLFPHLGKFLEDDAVGAVNFTNLGTASPKTFTDIMELAPEVFVPSSPQCCVLSTVILTKIAGKIPHVADALRDAWKVANP